MISGDAMDTTLAHLSRTRRRAPWRHCLLAVFLAATVSVPVSERRAFADADTAKLKYAAAYIVMVARGYTETRMEDVARINPGTAVSYPIFLYRNVQYSLFATQDQNIATMDIFITDDDDNILYRGRADEWGALVEFKPAYTGPYKAYVRNTRGQTGWYVVGLVY